MAAGATVWIGSMFDLLVETDRFTLRETDRFLVVDRRPRATVHLSLADHT